MYSEPYQTSRMELTTKIINDGSCKLFLKKVPSQVLDRFLNTPLNFALKIFCRRCFSSIKANFRTLWFPLSVISGRQKKMTKGSQSKSKGYFSIFKNSVLQRGQSHCSQLRKLLLSPSVWESFVILDSASEYINNVLLLQYCSSCVCLIETKTRS